MKKIELTDLLRVVLIILTWLLTFTVVTQTGTISNGGVGLIGSFAFYLGILYLCFVYFKDAKLMKNAKMSLVVVVFFVVVFLGVQCYADILDAFNVNAINGEGSRTVAYRIYDVLLGIYNIGRNVITGLCLLVAILNAFRTGENNVIEITKKETKEAENKEE